MTQAFEKPARPRTMATDFMGDTSSWIFQRKPPQRFLVIADRALVDDAARLVEHAGRMFRFPEITADGDESIPV